MHPEAYIKLKRYNLMYKKFPIEAMFIGPDPAVLHSLADSARKIMEQTPEVYLITTDWEPQTPMLNVEYDQATARALSISRNDVSISLLAATSGIPIGTFHEGIHRNNIYLKALDYNGKQIEDLENTQVFSTLPNIKSVLNEETLVKIKNGNINKNDLISGLMTTTPLKQICTSIDIKWEPPVVTRFNGQRSQKVQCSPIPGVETEKAWKIVSEKIENIELPDGYSLQWQGEKSASKQSMKYLFKNFPLAIILIISILIMLFKDYRKPLIILCCLPMILIGVVAVMLITGKTFNFVAIVGTLGLIGMLIKNGIVLMDEITLQLKSGSEPISALIYSAQSRLRPVMMASLTTILGMIPLLPDAMFGSLAASIMGGLLVSTIITLIFIPILYALFFHIKQPKQ
jgi:multidrug efflux pump subunit AcrB